METTEYRATLYFASTEARLRSQSFASDLEAARWAADALDRMRTTFPPGEPLPQVTIEYRGWVPLGT